MSQQKQKEWYEQWEMLRDDELFLFKEWIHPITLDDFRDKEILECGCGGGQHTSFVAPYAKEVVAVDLNTVALARERNTKHNNVQFVEADIATMKLNRKFDIIFSIGVVHHTDDPDLTVRNIVNHVKPGGKLILWVYSREGNFLAATIVEPFRKIFLKNVTRKRLLSLSKMVTAVMYIPIFTIYFLPLKFLPYYDYFGNFRKMSFQRNVLNVFDKLNAPQVQFISKERAMNWMKSNGFADINLGHYKKVSWRISGTKAAN